MKVDKLFAVLVVGGGMMAGCGGAPKAQPEEAPASAPADEAPAEDAAQPASAPAAAEDGDDGKCAWF